MRGLFSVATAVVAAFVARSVAVPMPMVVSPGPNSDVVITSLNTINNTVIADAAPARINAAEANTLQLDIVNNYGNDNMFLYIDGKDGSGTAILLAADGTYYYPDAGGSTVPVPITDAIATPLGAMGSTTTVTLPDDLISARIWVSYGQLTFFAGPDGIVEPSVTNPSDPSVNVPWGFVEFNWQAGSMFANISYVDWVGIVMGMSLTLSTGEVQTVKGLQAGSLDNICNDMKAQGEMDGQAWGDMCVNDQATGSVLRVLSPNIYTSVNPTAFQDYYTDYINQVWTQYASQPLMFNTQDGSNTSVSCQVQGTDLVCGAESFPQPTVTDIWGCNSGPFANQGSDLRKNILARLCAAFTRSTLLQDGGNLQPGPSSSTYYTTNPTNHYARIVHNYEQDGLGYAFSYDDVNPAGENAAGTVTDNGVGSTRLRVTVGGWTDE